MRMREIKRKGWRIEPGETFEDYTLSKTIVNRGPYPIAAGLVRGKLYCVGIGGKSEVLISDNLKYIGVPIKPGAKFCFTERDLLIQNNGDKEVFFSCEWTHKG